MRTANWAVGVLACAMVACVNPDDGLTSKTLEPLIEVAAVTVSPPTVTLVVGRTTRLLAIPKDGQGNSLPSTSVKWTSSDTSVALVSDSGIVRARNPGLSSINAKAGSIDGSAVVLVNQAPVSSVGVALGVSSLLVNQSTIATAELKDADGAILTGRAITWTSSNPSLATVSDLGLVTGVAAGTVSITAVSEGVSGSTSLSVVPAPVASVSVVPASMSLLAGTTYQLAATAYDADGRALMGRAFIWSSSNSSVASVSASGLMSAAAAGSAAITVTSEGKSAQSAVTVTQAASEPVATVAVSLGSSALLIGQGTQATATLRDASGGVLGGRTVTWASSNAGVATVSAAGYVTAVATGSATINATSEGKTGSATVIISAPAPVPVASVAVSPASANLEVGKTLQLTATTRDASGNVLSGRTVVWTSSAPAAASVSASGLVTALIAGSVTVTAASEGKTGSATMTISAPAPVPVASVAVSPASANLEVGKTLQLTATTRDASGNVLSGRTVAWTSSAPAVASVSTSGLVTALVAGSVTVTAASEGKTGSATLQVTTPPPPIASVLVTPNAATIDALGQTAQLTATAKDGSGATVPGATFIWTSVNTGVATVATTGKVTAKAVGIALIIAASGLITDTATVTVRQVPTTLTLNPTSVALAVGGTKQIQATVRDAGGAAIPGIAVAWASSATAVASVSSSGLVTAVANGSATITATANALSAAAAITVQNSPPPQPLLFNGDAETGDASQWCDVHSAVPLPPVVTSPVRDGNYAFKSEVRDGALIYGTERSEFSNGPTLCGHHTYKEGDENYTAVSIYPETNFPFYSHWSLVTQFKGPHTGTPPMQIALSNDKWGIFGNGRVSPRPYWFIGNIQRGRWNDFVFHAKWSPDPVVGWFEVYFQGQLVVPKTFASTMYLDAGVATPLFLSTGQYRDSGPTSGTGILYVDAVKVGTSLAAVMPPPKP